MIYSNSNPHRYTTIDPTLFSTQKPNHTQSSLTYKTSQRNTLITRSVTQTDQIHRQILIHLLSRLSRSVPPITHFVISLLYKIHSIMLCLEYIPYIITLDSLNPLHSLSNPYSRAPTPYPPHAFIHPQDSQFLYITGNVGKCPKI